MAAPPTSRSGELGYCSFHSVCVFNIRVSPDLEPTTTEATDALVAVLSDALRALADTGRSDQANRLAGRAYAALRRGQPAQAQRINVLMHRLARIPNTIKE